MSLRIPRISVAVLSAALLAACTAGMTGGTTGGPSSLRLVPDDRVVIGKRIVTVDVDYLDRYTFAADKPPVCQCTSLRLGSCICHC